MSATNDTASLLATQVRATMTPDESRFAHDERDNLYLALGLHDADVFFVIGSRPMHNGARDIDAFTAGYLHALTGAPLEEHRAGDFARGYDVGRQSLYLSHNADESPESSSMPH